MALVRRLRRIQPGRNGVHDEVECDYFVFREGGETYLQLDTYARGDRDRSGGVKQKIQLNRESALQLRQLLEEHFPSR
jgi:hypothetical protein